MDFGVCILAKPDLCAPQARLAEDCGFTHVWVGDTQMMAGDPYLCLGLIAQQTKRVKLGTGVAVVGTRIAPVTANSIATLNQLAPGRVILGIGTGNSAWRAMGMAPRALRELREHVRVVRELLHGGEVEYQYGEARRVIRFFHQDQGFVNTREAVPIHIAANAPKAMQLAGEIGDGFISSRTNSLAGWRDAWGRVCQGAEQAGKDPATLYTTLLTTACLLRPGESYESPRVKAEAGPWVTLALHALYERVQNPAAAPHAIRPLLSEYAPFVDRQRQRAGEHYYLELHDGHGLYLRPQEAHFVTPEAVQATTMSAPPEELLERLRALAAAGVKQVAFIPALGTFESFVREFSEKIIARF
ncbi:MAG TPA: LLM class flavin-dependent oxidoreductase [Candidatus Binatia bacterium]|jgi:alkanesulfonate monooxygenase SsuD/methylene tetrahydromethanopterin reductase-like flavin-dependent oxidoreductase (luciferase family)|nr:LLM class flavin-dependent oxidoreductase [Candidatus Binatia bacterium]